MLVLLSGLRRQTQGTYILTAGDGCSEPRMGRGFEYHFWQRRILVPLRKKNCVWFSVEFCLFKKRFWKLHMIFTFSVIAFVEKVVVNLGFSLILVDFWMSGWPSFLRRQTQGTYLITADDVCSGPRIWAWVRIPLLTKCLWERKITFDVDFLWNSDFLKNDFEKYSWYLLSLWKYLLNKLELFCVFY